MSLLDDLNTVAKYIDPSLAPVSAGIEKFVAAVVYHVEHGDNLIKVVKDAVEGGKADVEVAKEVSDLVAPAPDPAPAESTAAPEAAPESTGASASSLTDAELEAELTRRQQSAAAAAGTSEAAANPPFTEPVAPEVPH